MEAERARIATLSPPPIEEAHPEPTAPVSEYIEPIIAAPVAETREERLRKREEREIAAQVEQVKKFERDAAIAANGGVVPPGMETDEQLEAIRVAQEIAAKSKRDQEMKNYKAQQQKLQAQKLAEEERQRQAEQTTAAAAAAAAVESGDEPWYLDCEVCKQAGWRDFDEGLDLISCEQCEEWQHLDCHKARDIKRGKQINYDDDAYQFYCARCKANPKRTPRPIPKRPLPKSAKSQSVAQSPVHAVQEPPAKRAKVEYATSAGAARSAPSPPVNSSRSPSVTSAATPAAASNGASGGGASPPLSYEALKEMIQTNPILINQLPEQYQIHFSQLLGIPMP